MIFCYRRALSVLAVVVYDSGPVAGGDDADWLAVLLAHFSTSESSHLHCYHRTFAETFVHL